MRSSCWGAHSGGCTARRRNGGETRDFTANGNSHFWPSYNAAYQHTTQSALRGHEAAVPAKQWGLARLPPGLCASNSVELPLLGIASPPPHQKQPVSFPLTRGEQSVGLSLADPAAAPQAAGLPVAL